MYKLDEVYLHVAPPNFDYSNLKFIKGDNVPVKVDVSSFRILPKASYIELYDYSIG